MKARKTGGRIAGPSGPSPICAPLAHPLRVQILAVTNERDISPKAFVDEALQQAGIRFTSRANALSHVSYHFRELEKAGCIEVVDTRQRRGAVEHIYRGTCRVEFTTEEFDKLSPVERRRHSRTWMQALVARVEAAMVGDTLDSRTDRFMVSMGLELDQRGWDEFIALLDQCFAEIQRIDGEAGIRLADSDETAIPVSYGMLGFESPPSLMPKQQARA